MDNLGKYEIRRVLGRGAMGTVYEGWDPRIARRVAIKTVRLPDSSDSEERELLGRFQQEAQAAGRLQHPNIVGVFDYAETDELAYIVMEFVDGRTLKAVLDEAGPPGPEEVGRLMDGLLEGLHYSHGHQVIHRDIKPANIIRTQGGGVKIADFGIARIGGSGMTLAGTIMGTPAYMSPEQFKGADIDSRTDIYSAGVVLFQLLTGKRPFEGNMATIMQSVLNDPVPVPSTVGGGVSPALDQVVAQAMARAREDRFQTAGEMNQALQLALRQGSTDTGARGTASASGYAGLPGGAGGPGPGAGLGAGLGDLLGDDATVVQGGAPAPRPASPPPPPRQAAPPPPPAAPKTPAPGKPSRLPLVLAGVVVLLLLAGGGAYVLTRPGQQQVALNDTRPEPQPSPQPQPVPTPVPQPTPEPQPAPAPAPTPAPVEPSRPNPQVSPAPTPTPTPAPQPTPQPAPQTPPAPAPQPTPQPAPSTQPLPTPTRPSPSPIPEPTPTAPSIEPTRPAPQPVPQPIPQPTPQPVPQPTPQPTPQPEPPRPLPQPTLPTAPPVTPEPARPAPSPEPRPLPVAALAAAARNASCTAASVEERPRGTATVRGAAGSGAAERALRDALESAAPGAPIDWQVNAVDGPYCGALDAIRPYVLPPGQSSGIGVSVSGGNPPASPVMRKGELLMPRVAMPDGPAHLTLDYISSDGSLLHMRQAGPGQAYAAGASLSFGQPEPPRFKGWEIDEPYGTDILIAVASSTPLFRTPRPAVDTVENYVRDLRAALETASRSGARLSASVLVLRTVERR